jgi:guanine deaminase
MASIYWAHLDRVYYGNSKEDTAAIGFDDQFIYEEFARPMSERRLPMIQLIRDEANVPFQLWDVKPDKEMY